MNKKCLGCGVELQTEFKEKIGYTPSIDKDYCMRCFKLKNYGKDILKDLKIDNMSIIDKINKKNKFVLFLSDFYTINKEVIDIYNKIKCPKSFVLTKKDLLPKNIVEEKFIKNVRQTYQIKEQIYFISVKNNLKKLEPLLKKEKSIVICGFTVAGKSSFINKMCQTNILESSKESTTLDFIKIEYEDFIIYDTPGFVYSHIYKLIDYKKTVRPQIKKNNNESEFLIDNFIIKCNILNTFIFYLPNYTNILKRKNTSDLPYRINIPLNSDLIIKGYGFINIKNACIINTNLEANQVEVRDSVVGRKNE